MTDAELWKSFDEKSTILSRDDSAYTNSNSSRAIQQQSGATNIFTSGHHKSTIPLLPPPHQKEQNQHGRGHRSTSSEPNFYGAILVPPPKQHHHPQRRHIHNKRKNSAVSELFLAEAKSVQEKTESTFRVVNGEGSAVTSSATKTANTSASHLMSNKPRTIGVLETARQVSISSDDAEAPPSQDKNKNGEEPSSPKVRILVFENTLSNGSQQPPLFGLVRSTRKPLGLSYALRRTDSGSTFQSLDGLSSSYPLIRKDAKKRHKDSSKRREKHRQKSASSRSKSKYQTSFAFDSSSFACFAASCFPMDDIVPMNTGSSRGNRQRSTSSQQRRSKSPTATRDSPEKSKSSTRDELLLLRSQLRELRLRASSSAVVAAEESSIANTKVAERSIVPVATDVKTKARKTVRFTAPLITQISYRPYTPQAEIALLYFQEEELEELESDRETVSGDQIECQYDEAVMAVRIAFQQQGPE